MARSGITLRNPWSCKRKNTNWTREFFTLFTTSNADKYHY